MICLENMKFICLTVGKQNKGLESQEKALIEYCHNHGITNYEFYRDSRIIPNKRKIS